MTRRADAAAIALLAAAPWLLYRKVLRLWWTLDDPFHLNLIDGHGYGWIFFDRALWHGFVAEVFTPLLLASLRADVAAFGSRPEAFYLHQLIAFTLIGPLLYVLFRQWLDPPRAFGGALLGILGTPAAQIVLHLMLRHYVEGLVLALLATIAFMLAVRRDSLPLSVAAAALYLLAALAKEVFVPLPLLLAAMYWRAGVPPASRRASRPAAHRRAIPLWVALAVYAVWRIIVAGAGLHGYGWAAADPLKVIALLPARALRALAGPQLFAGTTLLVLLAVAAIIVVVRNRGARWLAIVGLLVALAPIAPVSIEMQPRYALVLWLLACAAAAFASRARHGLVLLAVTLVAAVAVNRIAWTASYRRALRMSDEARAFSVLGPDDLLYRPEMPPQTVAELARLTGSRARWTYDELPLCAGRLAPRRLFLYDAPRREVRETPVGAIAARCAQIRSAAPMSLRFAYRGEALFWDFGPYRDGRWRVIIADGAQGFDVPREGGFRLPKTAAIPLRVRYDAPAGWAAYSADLQVPTREGSELTWHR